MSADFSHFLIILAIYLKFLIQFFKLFSARRVSPDDALSTILLKMKVLFLSLFPHFCMPLFVIVLPKKLPLKLRSQMCRNIWKVLYYLSKAFLWASSLILYKIYILLTIVYISNCNNQLINIHTLNKQKKNCNETIEQCFPTQVGIWASKTVQTSKVKRRKIMAIVS